MFANNLDPVQVCLSSMGVVVPHTKEDTSTSSDSDKLRPFHKWDFSYKKEVRREFAPEGSQVFPFRAIP